MFKTKREKINFIRNTFANIEYVLSCLGETEYLGIPAKSIKAPNSQWEIYIRWDEENKLLAVGEANLDGKVIALDWEGLTNGQLDDFLMTTLFLFNCVVEHEKI